RCSFFLRARRAWSTLLSRTSTCTCVPVFHLMCVKPSGPKTFRSPRRYTRHELRRLISDVENLVYKAVKESGFVDIAMCIPQGKNAVSGHALTRWECRLDR